jgi:hypothetical protein
MNPTKAGGWAWIGVIGGILIFVSVFMPWMNLWGLAFPTGFQIGMLALSSGDGLIIFIVGNILFIWLFGIAGLSLLFASHFKLAMVFGILAVAFITLDLVIYFLADLGSLLSIGPFMTMAGAVMLTEGARKLAKGVAPQTAQTYIPAGGSPYGYAPHQNATPGAFPDYSNQALYTSSSSPGPTAYEPNATYGQTDQNAPPRGP